MKSNSLDSEFLPCIGPDSGDSASHEEDGVDDPAPLTREQRRSRRKRAVRSRTLSVHRVTRRELERARKRHPKSAELRPSSRDQCVDGPRPCPFVSCRYHLYVDVSPTTGAIKLNFPDLEVWELGESCALDVADREGVSPEDVGTIMNLTRERVRQLEVTAFAKLQAIEDTFSLRDFVDEGPAHSGIRATQTNVRDGAPEASEIADRSFALKP